MEDFKKVEGKVYVNKITASQFCGVSIYTYNNWCKQENPPPYDVLHRLVPVTELGEWVRKKQTLKAPRYAPGGVEQNSADRLERLRADKIQMELETKSGLLVSAEDVKKAWSDIMSRIKTRMTKIPTSLAAILHGEKDIFVIQKRLDDAIREALEDLADES